MHADAHNLAEHMQHLGLTMLGHAVHHTIFSDRQNQYYNAIGVLHAAQAAEVILKACIAAEHPLLIFAKLPKPEQEQMALTRDDLMKRGRTLQYAELPDVFWAATGYPLPAAKTYREFGELRNVIQHLGVPDGDLSERTLKFLVDVVDPVIQEFWATNLLRHLEPDEDEHFIEALDQCGVAYKGWMPTKHVSLGANHPLWLFCPWKHTVTNECVWVDEHRSDELRILRNADYEHYLKAGTAPTEWLCDWRAIFPSARQIEQVCPSDS